MLPVVMSRWSCPRELFPFGGGEYVHLQYKVFQGLLQRTNRLAQITITLSQYHLLSTKTTSRTGVEITPKIMVVSRTTQLGNLVVLRYIWQSYGPNLSKITRQTQFEKYSHILWQSLGLLLSSSLVVRPSFWQSSDYRTTTISTPGLR